MSTKNDIKIIKFPFNSEKLLNNPVKYVNNLSISDIEKLIQLLSESYYNTGKSIVSDKIYDIILNILEEKDPKNKILSLVGAKTKRSIKLPHHTGSLDKIKPDSDLIEKWVKKYKGPYVVSDKLDGVSCVIESKAHGIKLYTRGDGNYGSDITHLRNYVLENNLNSIPIGTVIRGELIINKKDFKKIESIMENSRNAVSGLVNSKKININVANITKFIAYGIMYPYYKQSKQMELLEEYGFNVVTYKLLDEINNEILSKYLMKRREQSKYDVDGIVVFDSGSKYKIEEGNPDYGFAFKSVLTNEVAEVKVLEVEWNVSKDGYYKPKIKIEPVRLAGVKISNVTGFNAKYIDKNCIGPGSVLKIVRSGDVIPHIIDVLEPSINNKPQMPEGEYEWTKTGIDIYTELEASEEIKTKKLVFFFKELDIKGIDEKVLRKLVDNKVDSVVKILTKNKTKILEIDGIGEKLLDKIRTNTIQQLKSCKMEQLMAASQMFGRGMGSRKLKKILNKYPNIFTLRKYDDDKLFDKIMKIDGFDKITTELFVDGLSNFIDYFEDLAQIVDLDILKNPIQNNINKNTKLKDQHIVFTGVRDKDVEKFIENNGGEIKTSVSSKTTMVIYSDKLDKLTAKLETAQNNGIQIIKLSEFKQKYM